MIDKCLKFAVILLICLGVTTWWVSYQVEGVRAEIRKLEGEVAKKKLEVIEFQILRDAEKEHLLETQKMAVEAER